MTWCSMSNVRNILDHILVPGVKETVWNDAVHDVSLFDHFFTVQDQQKTFFDALSEVTVEEIIRTIKRLWNKAFSPLDYFHTSILKSCVHVFKPLIARFINLSFAVCGVLYRPVQTSSGYTSQSRKQDWMNPTNYRPISNLNTPVKIIERICLTRLLPHISSMGNFSPLQSGYRKWNNTQTALKTCIFSFLLFVVCFVASRNFNLPWHVRKCDIHTYRQKESVTEKCKISLTEYSVNILCGTIVYLLMLFDDTY